MQTPLHDAKAPPRKVSKLIVEVALFVFDQSVMVVPREEVSVVPSSKRFVPKHQLVELQVEGAAVRVLVPEPAVEFTVGLIRVPAVPKWLTEKPLMPSYIAKTY
jgi:hypothetical protein